MADETINLDRDEVLAHLKHILGHDFEITEQQFEIFMHDLRKLIRKDQKRLFHKADISDDCECKCHNVSSHTKELDNDTESVASSIEPQSLPKSIPLKPTSSFIRPWNISNGGKNLPKNLKEDPVKLHQHYQNAWRKYRFPGDTGHSDLRWNIREKMMGQGPNSRPVSRISTQR